MALLEKVDVLPSAHEKLQDQSTFELSDIDQLIPGNHTTVLVVFPLSSDDNNSKKEIISRLSSGLQNVLTNVPLIGGKLHVDSSNLLSILRHNHEPLPLHVHHLDQDPEFPSYQTLEDGGFKGEFFLRTMTPPEFDPSTFRRDEGCPVTFFQATFIRGGLVLSVALHHDCGDTKNVDDLYVHWAASTLALTQSTPLPVWQPDLDRTYFNAAYVPDAAETQQLKKKIRGFTFHELSAQDSATRFNPPAPPAKSNIIYHFSPSATAKLKERCKPKEPGQFVSSYDSITALCWRAVLRARIPFLGIDPTTTESTFAHAVEVRGKFASKDYFGTGFLVSSSDAFPVSELIGPEIDLSKVALAIRKSTGNIVESSIPDLVKVRKGIEGTEEMRYIWHPQNVVATSWTGVQAYTRYDFGWGLPVSVRLPVSPFEGVFYVMPGNRKEGGFDVAVVQEDGCQERLKVDEEWKEYAEYIG